MCRVNDVYKDNAVPTRVHPRLPFPVYKANIPSMTITVHPARKEIEDVPPGTLEGTKQDAVMATAQLFEILERKKTGEKAKWGSSEYDAEMASAQIRAFKLTKVILRRAHRKSLSDAPVPIEKIGFEAQPRRVSPKPTPRAPPNLPLPAPPPRHPLA